MVWSNFTVFFFQAEDGIRDSSVTGVQTCALPISAQACTALVDHEWGTSSLPAGTTVAWRDDDEQAERRLRIVELTDHGGRRRRGSGVARRAPGRWRCCLLGPRQAPGEGPHGRLPPPR